jgi:hypothetical protein
MHLRLLMLARLHQTRAVYPTAAAVQQQRHHLSHVAQLQLLQ